MKPEERLFSAIGGVDESLLERSEGTVSRSRPRMGRYLVTAACLLLTVGVWLWSASVTGYLPGGGREVPAEYVPDAPEPATPVPETAEAPRLEQEGRFYLTRRLEAPGGQTAVPAYSLYDDFYGFQAYRVGERGEVFLRPLEKMPENTPVCQLGICHLPETTLEEAVEVRRSYNEARYQSVTLLDENSADLVWPWPERAARVCLLSSNGTAWNDSQAEEWFFDDGQGGMFVLYSHYFTEAAEGWGARFHDMICSFQVESETATGWKADLEDAVLRLADAAFAGELEEGSPLLSEGTKLYLKDLEAGEARVTGYAYDVITDGNGGFSGSADVQFRADDSESRSVLTMGLSYEDGRWLASWVSLRGENGLNYFPEQAAGLQ